MIYYIYQNYLNRFNLIKFILKHYSNYVINDKNNFKKILIKLN